MTGGEFAGLLSLQAVLAFLAGWIAKVWAERIARHEQAELSKRLHEVEAELKRQELEHEVQFRRVDEKVADVLSESYERLHRLYESVSRYVNPNLFAEELDVRMKETDKSNKEFCGYFFPKRLYVPPSLYTQTKEFYDRLIDATDEFTRKRRADERGKLDEPYWEERIEKIDELRNALFKEIVAAFQRRLGVTD